MNDLQATRRRLITAVFAVALIIGGTILIMQTTSAPSTGALQPTTVAPTPTIAPTTVAPTTTTVTTAPTTTAPTTTALTTTAPRNVGRIEQFPYPEEFNNGAACPSERYIGYLDVADFDDPSHVESVAAVCLDMKWNVIAEPPARDTAIALLGCADEMPEALSTSIDKRIIATPECDEAVNLLRLEDDQARFLVIRQIKAVRLAVGVIGANLVLSGGDGGKGQETISSVFALQRMLRDYAALA